MSIELGEKKKIGFTFYLPSTFLAGSFAPCSRFSSVHAKNPVGPSAVELADVRC